MQRRTFLKNSVLCAVAVSAYGFIRPEGDHYTGDCETTTDILGPYYRPGSPVRNNLVIPGTTGTPVELSGIIKHKDCTTPYKKAKIEIWHCDEKGVYDNSTQEFKYRGTTYTDDLGNYSFHTILPVPYGIGGGNFRPAHFHLMVTAAGYQPLVTQLYFTGDKHITEDAYASSPKAKRRILNVENGSKGTKIVRYDVSMAEVLAPEPAALDKLTGTYISETNPKDQMVMFASGNALWAKNEAFGDKFEYQGHNDFEYSGLPEDSYYKLHFDILASGETRLTSMSREKGKPEQKAVYKKSK
jgi:catechol 1,2-dioxygenase